MIFDLSDFNIPRPHSLFMGYVEVGERIGSIFMRRISHRGSSRGLCCHLSGSHHTQALCCFVSLDFFSYHNSPLNVSQQMKNQMLRGLNALAMDSSVRLQSPCSVRGLCYNRSKGGPRAIFQNLDCYLMEALFICSFC